MAKSFILLWLLLGHLAVWVTLYNRLHSWGVPRKVVVVGSGFTVAFLVGLLGVGLWWLLQGGWTTNLLILDPTAFLFSFGGERNMSAPPDKSFGLVHLAGLSYLGLCAVEGLWVVVRWIWLRIPRSVPRLRQVVRRSFDPPRADLINGDSSLVDRWLLKLVGNQSLQLELTQLELEVPQLPAELDGLRLVHLSDLHLSGRVPRRYFEHVVDVVNDQRPDFVFLTGDIVEKERCLPWAEEVFAGFRARYGCYFVLGNHELRLDIRQTRRALERAGLIDLGGRVVEVPISPRTEAEAVPTGTFDIGANYGFLGDCRTQKGLCPGWQAWGGDIREGEGESPFTRGLMAPGRKPELFRREVSWRASVVCGGDGYFGSGPASTWTETQRASIPRYLEDNLPRVILIGNERPWFRDLPPVEDINGWQSPRSLRIALSHTPDQIVWARSVGVDLLLAGHLHGGQIRLPGIGPIVSPSKFGVRYNAGLFFLPPTLLYVNRGLSARLPLRWNSKPEVACLILRSGAGTDP